MTIESNLKVCPIRHRSSCVSWHKGSGELDLLLATVPTNDVTPRLTDADERERILCGVSV